MADEGPVDDPIIESQRLPEPRIDLPTDGVRVEGPKRRIAAADMIVISAISSAVGTIFT